MVFAAVILAGGQSRRMGMDKADLVWKKKELWKYQRDIAKDAGCSPVFIARNQKGFLEDSLPYQQQGPLAGIEAALKQLQNEKDAYLLCLAVDMPLVTVDFLHELIQNKQKEAVVFEGQFFPFMIHVSVYSKLLEYLKTQQRSAQRFINSLSQHQVTPDPLFDFRNVNTQYDWNQLSL